MGLGLCIVGFTLFFLDKQASFANQAEIFAEGMVWVLAAALTWAIFASLQKKLLPFWSTNQINIFIYAMATILFLPFVDWQMLYQAPWFAHLLFIFLGINTLIAYGGLSVALRYLPATQVSPIITLNPLMTIFLIFLMEQFAWNIIPADPIHAKGYIGAFLAVSGVILVIRQKKRA